MGNDITYIGSNKYRGIPRIIPPNFAYTPPPELSLSKFYTLCPHITSSPSSKRPKLYPRNLSLVKNLSPRGGIIRGIPL